MRRVLSQKLHSLLKCFKYVRELYEFREHYYLNANVFPGHFYSPIVNNVEIRENEAEIWPGTLPEKVEGIHLSLTCQLEWVEVMKRYYTEIPFPETITPGKRYYFENAYYSYTDAIMLYSFFRKLKPKKLVEIGSGFSSAAMLDARDQLNYAETNFVFIDPYPERLESLLVEKDSNSVSIIHKKVQEVELAVFEALQAGDILFIDSSHVLKTGSDVHHILFNILPVLNKGVYIHFHDIFYPFEYPKEWVLNGTNWNELYAVRLFLMHNHQYTIECFSHYLHMMHPQFFEGAEMTYRNFGGCLWLKKC